MEGKEDKQWATKYLLDPLTAPEPSDETGPGTHFVAPSTASSKPTPSISVNSTGTTNNRTAPSVSVRSTNNPYRHSNSNPSSGYPTPPESASPRNEKFPALDTSSNRMSTASTQVPTSTAGVASSITSGNTTRTRRTSSLSQRHPGDQTHRPLEMLRHDQKAANRSPHLRKKHHVGADSIDSLDTITGSTYHHEGPYDATMLARNIAIKNPPVEALRESNEEALRATPREKVLDSLQRHYPLDGVAAVPPGMVDREGRRYEYEEGTDLMREGDPEGGAYRRYPGVQYHPDDLKGKGEPSFSIERALRTHNSNTNTTHRRNVSDSGASQTPASQVFEMQNSPTTPRRRPGSQQHDVHDTKASSPRSERFEQHYEGKGGRPGLGHRHSSADAMRASDASRYVDWERTGGVVGRSESGAGRLRKRLGSLRI